MTAGKLPVRSLLTHTFRIEQYRKALEASIDKDRYEAVKVAMDFRHASARPQATLESES